MASPAAVPSAAYAITATVPLLLCYGAVVGLLSSFKFALCSDWADSPQLYEVPM